MIDNINDENINTDAARLKRSLYEIRDYIANSDVCDYLNAFEDGVCALQDVYLKRTNYRSSPEND